MFDQIYVCLFFGNIDPAVNTTHGVYVGNGDGDPLGGSAAADINTSTELLQLLLLLLLPPPLQVLARVTMF